MEVQWPLVFFTLFISLGAGTLGATGALAALGKDEDIRMPALAVALAAIVVGGLCSFLHLQHWERIFNGFGHITSGITQELIGIVIAVVVIAIYFVLARKGDTPKWVGAVAIVAAVLLVAFMAHSYAMASRPAWNNALMYAFYLGGAFLLGALSVYLLKSVKDADTQFVATLTMVGGVIQTVVVLAYGAFAMTLGGSYTSVGNYFDSTVPTQGMQDPASVLGSFMTGDNALLYWGGAVLVGAVAPLIMGLLGKKRPGKQSVALAGIGIACALAGALAFRIVLYNVGFASYVFY